MIQIRNKYVIKYLNVNLKNVQLEYVNIINYYMIIGDNMQKNIRINIKIIILRKNIKLYQNNINQIQITQTLTLIIHIILTVTLLYLQKHQKLVINPSIHIQTKQTKHNYNSNSQILVPINNPNLNPNINNIIYNNNNIIK